MNPETSATTMLPSVKVPLTDTVSAAVLPATA